MDALEDLGIEDRVECEAPDCSNTATAYCIVQCCGASHLFCRKCMNDAIVFVNTLIYYGRAIVCASCDTTNNPTGWMTPPRAL